MRDVAANSFGSAISQARDASSSLTEATHSDSNDNDTMRPPPAHLLHVPYSHRVAFDLDAARATVIQPSASTACWRNTSVSPAPKVAMMAVLENSGALRVRRLGVSFGTGG